MSVSSLNYKHVRVLQDIFKHPVPHNLEWAAVYNLMAQLGSALERHDGKYEFHVGTQTEVFVKPNTKDMDPGEIARLRKFLVQAGVNAEGIQSGAAAASSEKSPTVVVIDHHSARFYAAGDGGHLVERTHLEPLDPHGFERHLEHRKEADYKGERIPEPTEYYERVAQQLKSADSVVLVGDATGKSSAVTFLAKYLEDKHPEIWSHVVATDHADLSSLSLGDIETIARRHAM